MPSFTERSYTKELLDRDDIPFADIRRNMQELDVINHRLGGHAITLEGLRRFLHRLPQGRPLQVAELGCGGGDNLFVLKKWAARKGLQIELTGIDINESCIRFAKDQERNRGIRFIHSDYRSVVFNQKPDLIFTSLFCHHFTDEELEYMLRWMERNSTMGFFINDLHRHPLAYYSIMLLTRLFSKSYLVKNDAPLSVRRGFIKKDWQQLFGRAGLIKFECRWKWAFRWLVTFHHQ